MPKTPHVEQHSVKEAYRNLGRITIIAVSVSEYQYLGHLPGVAKDRELIKDIFLGDNAYSIFGQSKFKELANPTVEATRKAILDYANSRSARGDILLFYFSGHGCIVGANSFGFCLTDTMMDSEGEVVLPLSVLGFREIAQTLAAVDVHPVFVIDACFSGATAKTLIPTYTTLMQDDLHIYAAGSYGLLCSGTTDVPAIDNSDGGVFTKAIHSIVSEGLYDNQQRHWPFLTIKSLALPLQELLARGSYRLSKCYLGPEMPEIPITSNIKYRPHKEYFAPYMKRTIEYIWNDGSPRNVTVSEIRDSVGPGAYANHSKLSLPPWGLLKNGKRKLVRQLTRKGKLFAKGKVRIPERIIRDPVSSKWTAARGTKQVLITDIQ